MGQTELLMPGRTAKVTAERWIATAREALIEEGIAGVKVDRLAQRLGVTRGGFYHNFQHRDELLDALLHDWEERCQFLPPQASGASPAEAAAWLQRTVHRLIEEDGYDSSFDMAVREWARSDTRTAWAVQRADRSRLKGLQQFFEALGYPPEEAPIRARVFYYHQIGYYALDVRQSVAERKRDASLYTAILCGRELLARAQEMVSGDEPSE